VENSLPITAQTKSTLGIRGIEILKRANDIEIGFTITTADEKIRKIFEPGASLAGEVIEALAALHSVGIGTFAMVAPILLGSGRLISVLEGKVNYVILDRLNYYYSCWVYKKYELRGARENNFF
jgi:DNA repair photolyase